MNPHLWVPTPHSALHCTRFKTCQSAFQERFEDSAATLELGQVPPAPDLALMDNNDLRKYLTVLSTVIKDTDTLGSRYQLFDSMNQSALSSPRDETELVERSLKLRGVSLPQP